MHATVKTMVRWLPLLAVWPLLQGGCVTDAARFELLNLVTARVFVAAQTIFDNLIDFDFG